MSEQSESTVVGLTCGCGWAFTGSKGEAWKKHVIHSIMSCPSSGTVVRIEEAP